MIKLCSYKKTYNGVCHQVVFDEEKEYCYYHQKVMSGLITIEDPILSLRKQKS